MKSYFLFSFLVFLITFPSRGFATIITGTGPDAVTSGGNAGAGNQTSTQFSRLQNPIQANSFQELINDIVFIAMLIGGPLVVLAFVYTGFLFVKAQGNSTKLSEAKDALLYTVIGAFILLGAQVIASLVGGTVDQFRSTP
jgi:hypothetical protein